MDAPNFTRRGDELWISGSLMQPLDMKFDIEANALLQNAYKKSLMEVTIDVCGVTEMGSQYIGALAAVAADMKKHGGGLTVRAKGKVAELLKQCGLHRLMKLELG